jgi:ABC-type uncharacterized transport system substrate-binding protein
MQNRIPVFTYSEKYLKMGAFMSVQINTFKLGKQVEEVVENIVRNRRHELPETDATDAVLTINQELQKNGHTLNG